VALRTFRRRWISGAASNRCAARHWRGRARSGGSSGEHAMKIIERDVAGASSGEAYQARTRSGGGAQLQRRGARKCILSCMGAERTRATENTAARSIMVLQRCCGSCLCAASQQCAQCAPRQLGGGERREGGPWPRRARFRRLCFCANFLVAGEGGVAHLDRQQSFHAVGAGSVRVQRPRAGRVHPRVTPRSVLSSPSPRRRPPPPPPAINLWGAARPSPHAQLRATRCSIHAVNPPCPPPASSVGALVAARGVRGEKSGTQRVLSQPLPLSPHSQGD
jgi:hypothetical protein